MKSQDFLDVRGMGVERLDESVARQDVGLVASIEMVHDTFAELAFRIAQTHYRTGTNLALGYAPWIDNRVSLSHDLRLIDALASTVS